MRITRLALWVLGSALTLTCSSALSAKVTKGYTFDFNPPHASEWQLVQNEFDARGYARTYALQKVENAQDQNVTISYGRFIKTSLKGSMKEVVDNIKQTQCKQQQVKTIQSKKDSLVFSTAINQCRNGKALHQIFKVFNMPDGQYSIIYTANPQKISTKTIAQMQQAVVAAKLVPIT